jgi:L-asparaginase/Glu-tRNA(Gln) amidotransferase subunit D
MTGMDPFAQSGAASSLDVGLVLTGGTVGSEYSVDDIVRIPAAVHNKWGAELELISQAWDSAGELIVRPRQPLRALSENIRPRDWLLISAAIRDLVDHDAVSGVLVLHGTDTAAYTSAALSFLLADLDVPIVLTGSNLPPNQPGSDALTNIRDALIAMRSLQRGVYLSFAGAPQLPSYVHLGTCVRKLRASGQAFYSINREPVGTVSNDTYFHLSTVRHSVQSTDVRSTRFEENVLGLRLYPGLDFEAVWAAVERANSSGLVIELYASATGPDVDGKCSLPTLIKRCADADIPVFGCVTEAAEDEVNLYESSVSIADAGAVLLDDILPETAIVKLMWTLGATRNTDEITRVMETSIAGERARLD